MKMVPSNVRKYKDITECDKSTVTCDVNTAQSDNGTIKCEKKITKLLNMIKVQSYVMLILNNVRIVSLNVIF